MNESPSRPRAATADRGSRAAARYLLACVVAITTVALVAGITIVAPAQGDTSPRYKRLWEDLSTKNKRWARHTSECESGGVRDAHGGGGAYHGAFQFALSTWRNAPKSPGGDAHKYSWKTQAVVAVYLKKRDGARTHWPHCG